jgi:guanylate kinase
MNKVIIVGKAASGKDHMRKKFQGRGFKYGIPYTSRPPREGELEGHDYYFLTRGQFIRKINTNFWYEQSLFNEWYYGISKDQFKHDCNLFVMSPSGIASIDPIDRKECTVIYLDIPMEERRSRLETRLMPGDSLDRRIEADENDFADFTNYDIRITNSNF